MSKKLSFEFRGRGATWPCFAFGFISDWREFVVLLWLFEFRIKWGI